MASADQVRVGAQNLWSLSDFSGVKILPRKKEKNIGSAKFYSNS